MTENILYFNYVAILIQVLILIVNFIYSNVPTRTTNIFRLLSFTSLFSGVFTTLSRMIAPLAMEASSLVPFKLVLIIGLLATNLVVPIYIMFIISLTHEQLKFKKHHLIIILIPIIYICVTTCTSPWTHFVMYYEDDGRFNIGIGMIINYVINGAYLILANVYMIRHRDRVSPKQIHIVLAYTVFILAAIVVQSIKPYILVIELATSISIFLIYFTLRNPSEFIDRNNGCLNRTAFKEYFFTKRLSKKHYSLGVIHVTNFETVKQNYGTSNAYYLLRQNIEELQKVAHFNKEFYLFHNTFVFMDKDPEYVKAVLKNVKEFIPIPMQIHTDCVDVNSPKITVHFLTDVYFLEDIAILNLDSMESNLQNPTDKLIDLLEFAVNNEELATPEINNIDQDVVTEYEEIVKIQQAIQKAIRNDSFEVYLQPIFDFKTNSFTGAESLLRLKNEEGKFIPPTRFIHQAELNGTILILGDISLRKTCEYIKTGNLQELGINKVNVNLSIIQCMQDDIVQHLTNILDEYEIPKEMIRFEITETLMAKDSFHLEQVMRELTDLGIEFALDDYGTGYSNTSRLLDFPFSEIKFDKSFVDSTLEDEKNAIPLKHLMNMVKDTGRIVLVEGVETKEMSDLIKQYGGDLIQGFYYAKPLPQDEFVKLIKDANKK